MTTLADLRVDVAQDLRDTGNATWTVAELDDLINRGIDALADVYPREIVATVATATTGTFQYALAPFISIYRLDRHNSAATFLETIPRGTGDHPDSGWETHQSTLFVPTGMTLTTGDLLRAFGYARYIVLSAATSVTDVDASGLWAVRVFAQTEAFAGLLNDRAAFQQWQSNSNNTDVTALGLAQLYGQAQARWDRERRRLRRIRK
jgi:hypothetical protein